MAAALGTWSSASIGKPTRIEGHTSNVESKISYRQIIEVVVGETTETGDTYNLPHAFDKVDFIGSMPIGAEGANFLLGGTTTLKTGASYANAATVQGPTEITTVATAGATTVVLTGASGVNDVYNFCTLEIRYADGDLQTVKITDYVGSSKLATIDQGLAKNIAATGSNFVVKGTLITVDDIAVTPTLIFDVTGSFV
jgi:hypothetical protein